MNNYDLGQISHLLYVEEQLRAHPFMKPVHEEVLAELRAHAAGERPAHPQEVVKESVSEPELDLFHVDEPEEEPDHAA